MSENKKEYTSEQLQELSINRKALAEALQEDPKLPIKKDENGQTILHHVCAQGGFHLGSFGQSLFSRKEMLPILFESECLDFNIQDNEGCTPLHVAFRSATNLRICEIIPQLLSEAQKRSANFELLDDRGCSIYHDAVIRDEFLLGRASLVDMIDANLTNPNWNNLSKKGITPFSYAIYKKDFDNAHKLLEKKGIEPLLCASEFSDPLRVIQEMFDENSDEAKESQLNEIVDKIKAMTNLRETVQTSVSFSSSASDSSQFLPPLTDMVLSCFFPAPRESKGAGSVLEASSTTTGGSTLDTQEDDVQGEDDFAAGGTLSRSLSFNND